MPSVGSYLRELRQQRGVSLDEISRSTRVPQRHLELLEADDFAALPAPPFTRGFIRAYCQALHEPPDEALTHYEASRPGGLGPGVAQRRPQGSTAARSLRESTTRQEKGGHGAILVSLVLLVVLGAALFAVTLALQPPEGRRAEQRTPESTAVPSSEPVAPRPDVTAETPPTEDAPLPPQAPGASAPTPGAPTTPAPAALAGAVASYRLVARTSESTWMRVRTEDGRMSEENIPAGEVREWVSNRPFVLSIGNAGGVILELNGRRLPPLGPSGAMIGRLVVPAESQ